MFGKSSGPVVHVVGLTVAAYGAGIEHDEWAPTSSGSVEAVASVCVTDTIVFSGCAVSVSQLRLPGVLIKYINIQKTQ